MEREMRRTYEIWNETKRGREGCLESRSALLGFPRLTPSFLLCKITHPTIQPFRAFCPRSAMRAAGNKHGG